MPEKCWKCGRDLELSQSNTWVCSGCKKVPDLCQCIRIWKPPRRLIDAGIQTIGKLEGVQASPNLSDGEKVILEAAKKVIEELVENVSSGGYQITELEERITKIELRLAGKQLD